MKSAFIHLHISVFLAGFTGVFGRLITINEGMLVWWRVLIAGACMLAIMGLRKSIEKLSPKQASEVLFSGFLLTIHWLFFYASIKYSNISVGVVCFSLVGLFTALLSPIINRRKFVATEIGLSLLTLAGVLLIFSFDTQYRVGIILGVISSLFCALYTIKNEHLAHKHKSETVTLYTMISVFVVISAILPFYLQVFPVESFIPSTQNLIYLVLLALFCTLLLQLLQTMALRKLSAFTVNLSLNLEPVYSIILAIIIFNENEDLTGSFYAGLGLIVLSVVLQVLIVRNSGKATQSTQHAITPA